MTDSQNTSTISHGHDRSAKRLLRHRKVIADLLRGFVPEGPLRRFDPQSLVRQSDTRVDHRLRQRQSDLTWAFTLENGARVAMILEMQSTVDPNMAARMAAQTAMYYENRAPAAPGEPPPLVLPVVFYTGERPWRASRTLAELPPAWRDGLGVHFDLLVAVCYFLIEARNIPWELLPPRNRASLMIRMWTARSSRELMEALESEREWLERDDSALWKDFLAFARMVLAPLKFPEFDVEQIHTLEEGLRMLNQGVVKELEDSRRAGLSQGLARGIAKGRVEGIAEGRVEGLAEGQRSLLRRQIARKFGDGIAAQCAERLANPGGNGRMQEVGDLLIDCRTGEEFLARL